MKYINLGKSQLKVSQVALGCMRLVSLTTKQAYDHLQSAYEQGINFYDHADIYGAGQGESIFGKFLKDSHINRQDIVLQSKCGIDKLDGTFNWSKEHIIKSVEGSLERLKTDYLDVLLLHRPDTLFIGEEVNEAFEYLLKNNMVKNFGVSNLNSMQIELLQKYLSMPIITNQMQLSITNSGMITNGLNVNINNTASIDRAGSVLEYCRLKDITIQPWSPFQYGLFNGCYVDNDNFPNLNECLNEIAVKYNITKTGVVIAWLNKHPANFVTVVGTMTAQRLKDSIEGCKIEITRKEWYDIYKSAGNVLP